jgi:hypothetical protein
VTSKARLPLLPTRPSARAIPATVERVPCDRALVCVFADAESEATLDFAYRVLERVRTSGRDASVLLSTNSVVGAAPALRGGASVVGTAQRLSALGADVHALAESELPGAALRVIAESPHDAVVVALGASFAAHFEALLTVRLGACLGLAQGAACDLDISRDDGLIATLIGDWIGAHLLHVSEKPRGTSTENPCD